MKCLQCGKSRDDACGRTDCYITHENKVKEKQKEIRAESLKANRQLASSEFQSNFEASMAWAVREGHIREQDVPLVRQYAGMSQTAPECYQAIVRTL